MNNDTEYSSASSSNANFSETEGVDDYYSLYGDEDPSRGPFEEESRIRVKSSRKSRGLFANAVNYLVPNVVDTHEKIGDAAASFEQLATSMNGMIPHIETLLEQTAATVTGYGLVAETISKLTESVERFVKQIPTLVEYVKQIVDSALILVDFIIMWMDKNWKMIPTLIMRLLSTYGLNSSLASSVFQSIFMISDPNESQQDLIGMDRIEAHSGVDRIEAQMGNPLDVARVFVHLTGALVMGSNPDNKKVRQLVDLMRFRQMFAKECDDSMKIGITIIRSLPDCIKNWLSYVCPTDWWIKIFDGTSKYATWLEDVEKLEGPDVALRANFDRDVIAAIKSAHDRANEFLKECVEAKAMDSRIMALIKPRIQLVDKLHDAAQISMHAREWRVEPFCVYLGGNSGVGKSFLNGTLPYILARVPKGTPNVLYSRNVASQYWDGYTEQFAVSYNDYNCLSKAPSPPGEHAELITQISNEVYLPNRADLSDKGKPYNSKAVFCSSNIMYPNPTDVMTTEALRRRRHFLVEVMVKPEYRITGTTRLDVKKVPLDGTNPQWVFQRYDGVEINRPIGNPMSYDQFVNVLLAAYDEHAAAQKRAFDNRDVLIKNAMDRVRAERGDAQGLWEDFERNINIAKTKICTTSQLIRQKLIEFRENDPKYKWFMKWLPMLGTATAMIGTFFIMRKRSVSPSVSLQSHGAYQHVGGRGASRVVREVMTARGLRPATVRAYQTGFSQADQNALEVLRKRVWPNMAFLRINTGITRCLFIKGRILLVPSHMFYNMNGDFAVEGMPITVVTGDATFDFRLQQKNLIKIDTDLVLLQCPVIVRPFKDISRHFLVNADLDFKRRYPAVLAMLNDVGEYMGHSIDVSANVKPAEYPVRPESDIIMQYDELSMWKYPFNPGQGQCGSVVVATCPSFMHKITGMHVGGFGSDGWAHVITQEQIDEALALLPQDVAPEIIVPHGLIPSMDAAKIEPQGNFYYLGTFEKANFIPTKSQIVPSLIHDQVYQHTTLPSVLRTDDVRCNQEGSPLARGVEKYGGKAAWFDPEKISRITSHLVKTFDQYDGPIDRVVVSETIAINGIAGVDYIDPIEMSTSPGYPYTHRPGRKAGKRELFMARPDSLGKNYQPIYEIDDKELRIRVDLRWKSALEGKRISSVWIDTLKDERRDIEKIESGKTRVFTIPPVDFTIVARRLFLAFNAMFYQTRLKTFSAVGINPESPEWTFLYNKLRSKGSMGFAGDYSAFDGTLSPQIMKEACILINAWYNDAPEFQVARQVIFEELIFTMQNCVNVVYVTMLGNPSGNPFTSILNTIVGAYYLRYCWLELSPPEYRSLQHYDEHVADAIYGDDNIVTPSMEVMPFYGPDEVSLTLKKAGIKYTSATCKSRVSTLEVIEDLTFLKRGFRHSPLGLVVPTMNLQTIYELTNWVRKSDFQTEEESLMVNLDDSLYFMFFYGRDNFNIHREKILKVLPKKLKKELHDYQFYDDRFRSKYLNIQSFQGIGRELQKQFTRNSLSSSSCSSSENAIVTLKRALNYEPGYQGSALSEYPCNYSHTQLAMDANYEQNLKFKTSSSSSVDRISAHAGVSGSNNFLDLSNEKGILMGSQRAVDGQKGIMGMAAPRHDLAIGAINETEWTTTDMTHRSAFVKDGTWTTAQTTGAILERFEVPKDLLVAYFQTAIPERFTYWYGNITLKVRVNGTRFHAGRLIVAYAPFVGRDAIIPLYGTDLTSTTILHHEVISASTNNPVNVTATYTNPKSYITINVPWYNIADDYSGTLFIQVLSPLVASATAPQGIDYAIWATFDEDQHFRVPLHTAAVARTMLAKYQQMLALETSRSTFLVQDGEEIVESKVERINAQGNYTSTTNNITANGAISDLNMPTQIKNDAFSGNDLDANLSGLPMDYPSQTNNGIPFYRLGLQGFANTKGPVQLTRLDLCGGTQAIGSPAHFGTEVDECGLKYLVTKPSYVTQVTWNAADPSGTLLYGGLIGPMAFAHLPDGSTSTRVAGDEFTGVNTGTFNTGSRCLLDYIAARFRFWRGSIRFKIDVVASQMHSGRLFLSANYGALPADEVGLRDATSQYGIEIDLNNESQQFYFEIPWKAQTEWLMTSSGPTTSIQYNLAQEMRQCFLGSWNLRVLNQLKAPETAAANIAILIYISGGDDFEVYYPDICNASLFPALSPPVLPPPTMEERDHIEAQSGEGTDAAPMDSTNETQVDTAIAISPDPQKRASDRRYHFGEKYKVTHLCDVWKRYVPDPEIWRLDAGNVTFHQYSSYVSFAGTIPLFNNRFITPAYVVQSSGLAYYHVGYAISVTPTPAINNGTSPVPQDPLLYYGKMFRLWRGSLRYRYLFDTVDHVADDGTITRAQNNRAQVFFVPQYGNATNLTLGPILAAGGYQASATLNTYSTLSSYNTVSSWNALAMSNQQAPYLDVEIPFTTRNDVLTVPYATTAAGLSTDAMQLQLVPGILYAFQTVSFPAALDVTIGKVNDHSALYKAGGDDFRYGVMIKVPKWYFMPWRRTVTGLVGATSYPDFWPVTPPPAEEGKMSESVYVSKKVGRRVRKVGSDEYEVIEAQSGDFRYVINRATYEQATTVEVPAIFGQARAQQMLLFLSSVANIGRSVTHVFEQFSEKYDLVYEIFPTTTIFVAAPDQYDHYAEYRWNLFITDTGDETDPRQFSRVHFQGHSYAKTINKASYLRPKICDQILREVADKLRDFIMKGTWKDVELKVIDTRAAFSLAKSNWEETILIAKDVVRHMEVFAATEHAIQREVPEVERGEAQAGRKTSIGIEKFVKEHAMEKDPKDKDYNYPIDWQLVQERCRIVNVSQRGSAKTAIKELQESHLYGVFEVSESFETNKDMGHHQPTFTCEIILSIRAEGDVGDKFLKLEGRYTASTKKIAEHYAYWQIVKGLQHFADEKLLPVGDVQPTQGQKEEENRAKVVNIVESTTTTGHVWGDSTIWQDIRLPLHVDRLKKYLVSEGQDEYSEETAAAGLRLEVAVKEHNLTSQDLIDIWGHPRSVVRVYGYRLAFIRVYLKKGMPSVFVARLTRDSEQIGQHFSEIEYKRLFSMQGFSLHLALANFALEALQEVFKHY